MCHCIKASRASAIVSYHQKANTLTPSVSMMRPLPKSKGVTSYHTESCCVIISPDIADTASRPDAPRRVPPMPAYSPGRPPRGDNTAAVPSHSRGRPARDRAPMAGSYRACCMLSPSPFLYSKSFGEMSPKSIVNWRGSAQLIVWSPMASLSRHSHAFRTCS